MVATATDADSSRRAFFLEQFRDYLALEAGNSANTVGNYVRDIVRLIAHAAAKGARTPDAVTAAQLREFVYDLKDLGLAPATIRRQKIGRASCRERVEVGGRGARRREDHS